VVTVAIWGEVTPGAILTKCRLWGDILDVITCAIFRDCGLRGVGVMRGVSLPSTGTLPCDRVIRHTLCRKEWVQSCYKRSQHVTCYQLARNSFAGFTGKFQYLQILLLLPTAEFRYLQNPRHTLPSISITCKFNPLYCQHQLLANSAPPPNTLL